MTFQIKWLKPVLSIASVSAILLSLYGCTELETLNRTIVRNRTYDYARQTITTPKPLVIPKGVGLKPELYYPEVKYNQTLPPVPYVNIGPPMMSDFVWVVLPKEEFKVKMHNLQTQLSDLKEELKDEQRIKAMSTSGAEKSPTQGVDHQGQTPSLRAQRGNLAPTQTSMQS